MQMQFSCANLPRLMQNSRGLCLNQSLLYSTLESRLGCLNFRRFSSSLSNVLFTVRSSYLEVTRYQYAKLQYAKRAKPQQIAIRKHYHHNVPGESLILPLQRLREKKSPAMLLIMIKGITILTNYGALLMELKTPHDMIIARVNAQVKPITSRPIRTGKSIEISDIYF